MDDEQETIIKIIKSYPKDADPTESIIEVLGFAGMVLLIKEHGSFANVGINLKIPDRSGYYFCEKVVERLTSIFDTLPDDFIEMYSQCLRFKELIENTKPVTAWDESGNELFGDDPLSDLRK